MTKKKIMKNIKTPNKFWDGGAFKENFREGFSEAMKLPDGSGFKDMFSAANMGKTLGTALPGMIGTLGGVAGGLISDGFSTTGGQVLSGIGDATMMFNPLVGAAFKAASGLINRGFGTKWDSKGLAKAESQIAGLNNFQSSASDYDTLVQDFTRIGSMNKTIKASDLGEDGWFVDRTTNKANELNTDLGKAYNYAMRNANNVADNIASSTLASLERNYAAFGGPLFAYGGQTHGADFTNGLMFINNGGTHESNPYEGIPISMDREGNPNLVEEGEVIWNDYVFSNRLKVPKSIQKKYKLGKREMTFAKAVNKLSKESEERPNDPISMRGLDSLLMNMVMEQETLKSKQQNKNTNKNKFPDGGDAKPYYSWMPGYYGEWYGEDGNYTKEYLDAVNDYTKDQLLWLLNKDFAYYSDAKNKGTERYKVIEEFYKNNPDFAKQLPRLSDDLFLEARRLMTNNDPDNSLYMHLKGLQMKNAPYTGRVTMPYQEGLRSAPTLDPELVEAFKSDIISKNSKIIDSRKTTKGLPIDNLPTWMRYAPAIGFGALALTDALGLTNKPDYTNADAIIDAAKNVAVYDPIKFKPIGDYLAYNPFDTEYHANQLRSVAGANRRYLMNVSGGNRAAAMAGILASDNNTMNQLGDLYRKAAEYNLEQRQKVADFNRATNITNSEGFYKADAANQSAALQARGLGLEGLMKGYTMREQAKLMSDQARSANLSGLFTSLGNIGFDNANRNMTNWSILTGTWAPSQWTYDPFTGKPINQNQ